LSRWSPKYLTSCWIYLWSLYSILNGAST
jgi:hypothetical protein